MSDDCVYKFTSVSAWAKILDIIRVRLTLLYWTLKKLLTIPHTNFLKAHGSSVWDPHTKGLQEELEKVQNHGIRKSCKNSFSAPADRVDCLFGNLHSNSHINGKRLASNLRCSVG